MSERIEAILNLVGQGKGVTIEGERLMADEIERLRADNRRLNALVIKDAGGTIVTQGAFNAAVGQIEKLRAENADLKERFRDLRVGPRPTGGWPYEDAAEAAGGNEQ